MLGHTIRCSFRVSLTPTTGRQRSQTGAFDRTAETTETLQNKRILRVSPFDATGRRVIKSPLLYQLSQGGVSRHLAGDAGGLVLCRHAMTCAGGVKRTSLPRRRDGFKMGACLVQGSGAVAGAVAEVWT